MFNPLLSSSDSGLSVQTSWPFATEPAECVVTSTDYQHFAPSQQNWASLGLANPKAKSIKRQAEFYAGRLCAHTALLTLTQRALALTSCAEHGFVIWPVGVCGSITHSNGQAYAIVAPNTLYKGIGIDKESIVSEAKAQRLASQVLTKRELAVFTNLPTQQQGLFFTQVFSIKESLFKALYPTALQFFGFQDAEALPQQMLGNANLQIKSIKLLKSLSFEWPAGTEFAVDCIQIDHSVLSLIRVPH